jgi:hypothetical protein
MQRLEVSGAVRPLKWPLGVKWLKGVDFCDESRGYMTDPEGRNPMQARNKTQLLRTDRPTDNVGFIFKHYRLFTITEVTLVMCEICIIT